MRVCADMRFAAVIAGIHEASNVFLVVRMFAQVFWVQEYAFRKVCTGLAGIVSQGIREASNALQVLRVYAQVAVMQRYGFREVCAGLAASFCEGV